MALPGDAAVAIPLNFIDNLLLELGVGQVLIAVFVLAMLAALPLRSPKVLAINVVAFGIIFILTPYWVVDGYNLFLYAGIAMIFVGTMGFVYARR
ncbi:MAG: hypothetical protein ACLFMX_08770 [Halobacteriales archaeon]